MANSAYGAVAEGGGANRGPQAYPYSARGASRLLEAADEEFLVDDHDDDRSAASRARPMATWLPARKRRQRPAPHHVAHGEVHQHDQKADRGDEAVLQLRRFMVLQRLECLGRPGGRRLRALALCAIARLRHGGDNGGFVAPFPQRPWSSSAGSHCTTSHPAPWRLLFPRGHCRPRSSFRSLDIVPSFPSFPMNFRDRFTS